ncbi:MOSC domain-containing protein [Cellulosimicrobium marinum]|uniref:MOSC domain-containing protein n=1 Tax=Cellulosimicrobium marinum TaxID=1638992 RepID=UPI001E4C9339|nr:MOSC domain-containing protein [Cellulosimicrobium marinum]MCB7135903.1 MOSC domain-containing protein [Cellulosimicrobium marinum]
MTTDQARVLQVRTGQVGVVEHRGRAVPSGFRKEVRTGPVTVDAEGLVGDEQGDRRVHGGPDKALCAYPVEHYAAWPAELGTVLAPGSFGENLVTRGLHEDELQLGDVLVVGSVRVQVTTPRRPCYKLAAVHGRPDLPDRVQESGRTGFYLRVLEPGTIAAGAVVRLVDRACRSATVREVNRVMNVDRDDLAGAAALVDLPTMPPRWRDSLRRRLGGAFEDDTARLRGTTS